jgi:hypothetical protein
MIRILLAGVFLLLAGCAHHSECCAPDPPGGGGFYCSGCGSDDGVLSLP